MSNNMSINKVRDEDELLSDISSPKPSKELLEALKESEKIIQEIKDGKRTGYKNISDLINSLNED